MEGLVVTMVSLVAVVAVTAVALGALISAGVSHDPDLETAVRSALEKRFPSGEFPQWFVSSIPSMSEDDARNLTGIPAECHARIYLLDPDGSVLAEGGSEVVTAGATVALPGVDWMGRPRILVVEVGC